jgi:two-component system response regulator PhoP
MPKILLVEDNTDLAKQLTEMLQGEHYHVESCNSGTDGLERLRFFEFDLAVIDWGLPGLAGIEVLKQYRSAGGKTPILMLTGRDSINDKAEGLETGADDYLTKPFHVRELVARIKALLRRGPGVYQDVFKAGSIELHPSSHRALKDGVELKLQPKEFALLEFLLRNPDDIFSLEALQKRIWESDSDASPETVRVCITRLRAKIDSQGQESLIRTVPRIGYQLCPSFKTK